MRSMTGFGRGTAGDDAVNVTVDIKTVNNRFLDINMRLPAELQAIENDIRSLISARLSRGRADINVQLDRTSAVELELDEAMIGGYLAAVAKLQGSYGLSGEPDINMIARLPNVFRQKKAEIDEQTKRMVLEAVDKALSALTEMRGNEGSMLAKVLSECIDQIESRIPEIASLAAGVADEYQARLSKRIEDMLAKSGLNTEIDKGRLAQEAAYLADKADISEEITRLKGHIGHFREIMADEKDAGKRLDFLTQELNREANTIASKTNNMTVKENALAIKSEIEKIREQVQNIE